LPLTGKRGKRARHANNNYQEGNTMSNEYNNDSNHNFVEVSNEISDYVPANEYILGNNEQGAAPVSDIAPTSEALPAEDDLENESVPDMGGGTASSGDGWTYAQSGGAAA